MRVPKDPLFDIFQRHVTTALMAESETPETLIAGVVKEYMGVINKQGIIPHRLYSFLEEDVREDVAHMLKKTTYGYFNLDDYRRSRRGLIDKLKIRGS